jgi:hypothetical protein
MGHFKSRTGNELSGNPGYLQTTPWLSIPASQRVWLLFLLIAFYMQYLTRIKTCPINIFIILYFIRLAQDTLKYQEKSLEGAG